MAGDIDFYFAFTSPYGYFATALAEAMNSTSVKDQLRTEVEQAMARGMFGTPFMVVDGASSWDFDRFDQMEALLRNGRI